MFLTLLQGQGWVCASMKLRFDAAVKYCAHVHFLEIKSICGRKSQLPGEFLNQYNDEERDHVAFILFNWTMPVT